MGSAMILGAWSANRAIEKMTHDTFQCAPALLLVLITVYMVIHG
jgi:hypothetical protein